MRDEIYEGLSIEQEEILLAEIAYDGIKEDQLFFDKRWLSGHIRDFLEGNLNAPKHLDSEAVLNAIEVQQGILVERVEGRYSFSHLTLQEYLAAQYLVDNNGWEELVRWHITDDRWREIFLLLPGLMSGREGADSLLIEMSQQAYNSISTPRQQALMSWAASEIDTIGQTPLANRAAAIFLVIDRACDLTLDLSFDFRRALNPDLTRTLDLARARILSLTRTLNSDFAHDRSLSRDLDRDLALDSAIGRSLELTYVLRDAKIFRAIDFDRLVKELQKLKHDQPHKLASYNKKEEFVKSINDLWFSTFGIASDVAALTKEEALSFSIYFYICELMVRCKDGATRVSPKIWKNIESSILTTLNINQTLME